MKKKFPALQRLLSTARPAVRDFALAAASRPVLFALAALLPLMAWFYHATAVGRLVRFRFDYGWPLIAGFLLLAWLPIFCGQRRFEISGQSSQSISIALFWVVAAALSWFWGLWWWSVDWPVWWCVVWLALGVVFSHLGFKVFVGWSEIWRRLWLALVAARVRKKIIASAFAPADSAFLSPNQLRIVRAVHDHERLRLITALTTQPGKAGAGELVAASAALHACYDKGPRWGFAAETDRAELRQWLLCELALDEAVLITNRSQGSRTPVWLPMLVTDHNTPRPRETWIHAIETLAGAHALEWDDWLARCLTAAGEIRREPDLKVPYAASPTALFAQAWLSLMPAIAGRCHIPVEERLDAWLEIARITSSKPHLLVSRPASIERGNEPALGGTQAGYSAMAVQALDLIWGQHHATSLGDEARMLSAQARPGRAALDGIAGLGDDVWTAGVKEASTIASWPYQEVWEICRRFALICMTAVTGLSFAFLLCNNPSLSMSLGWNTVDKVENRAFMSALPSLLGSGGRTTRAAAASGQQMAEATETGVVVHDLPTRVSHGRVFTNPARDVAAHPIEHGFVALGEASDLHIITPDPAVFPYLSPEGGSLWPDAEPGPLLAIGMQTAAGKTETGGASDLYARSGARKDFVTVIMQGAGVGNYLLPSRSRGRLFGTWQVGTPHKVLAGWLGEAVAFTYDGTQLQGFDRSTLVRRDDFSFRSGQTLADGVKRFDSGWPGTHWAGAVSNADELFFADTTTKGWAGPFFKTFTDSFDPDAVTSLRVVQQILWMNSSKAGLIAYDMPARSLTQLMKEPLCLLETVPGGVLAAGAQFNFYDARRSSRTLWPSAVQSAAVSPSTGASSQACGGPGIVFESATGETKPLRYLAGPEDSPVQIHSSTGIRQHGQATRISGVVPQPDGGVLFGSDIPPFVYDMDQHDYRLKVQGQQTHADAPGPVQSAFAPSLVSSLSSVIGGNHGTVGLQNSRPFRFDGKTGLWNTLDPSSSTTRAVVPPMKEGALYWGLTNTDLRSYHSSGSEQPRRYCDLNNKSNSHPLAAITDSAPSFIGDTLVPGKPAQGFVFTTQRDVITYRPLTGTLVVEQTAPLYATETAELRVLGDGESRVWRAKDGRVMVRNTAAKPGEEKATQQFADFGSAGVGDASQQASPRIIAIATPPGQHDRPQVLLDGQMGGMFRYDWQHGSWLRLSSDAILPPGIMDFSAPMPDVGLIHDSQDRVWICPSGKSWQQWTDVTKAAAYDKHLFGLTPHELQRVPLQTTSFDGTRADAVYCNHANVRAALARASLVWQPDPNTLVVAASDGSVVHYDHATASTQSHKLKGAFGTLQFMVQDGHLLAVGPTHAWWFKSLATAPLREESLAGTAPGRSSPRRSTCTASQQDALVATLGGEGEVTVRRFQRHGQGAPLHRAQIYDSAALGGTVLAWREDDLGPLFMITREGAAVSYRAEVGVMRMLRRADPSERVLGWRPCSDRSFKGYELLISQPGKCSIVRVAANTTQQPWPAFDMDAAALPGFLANEQQRIRQELASQTLELKQLQEKQTALTSAQTLAARELERLQADPKPDAPTTELEKALNKSKVLASSLTEAQFQIKTIQSQVERLQHEDAQTRLQSAPFSTQPALPDSGPLRVAVRQGQLILTFEQAGAAIVLHSGVTGFREDHLIQLEYASDGTLWAVDESGDLLQLATHEVNGSDVLLPRHVPAPDVTRDTTLTRSASGAVMAATGGQARILHPQKASGTVATLALGAVKVEIRATDRETGFDADWNQEHARLFDEVKGCFAWQSVSDIACDAETLYLSTPMGLLLRNASTFAFTSLRKDLISCKLASAPGSVIATTAAAPVSLTGNGTELVHRALTGPWEWSQTWSPFARDAAAAGPATVNHASARHQRAWVSNGEHWVWRDDFATGLLTRQKNGLLIATQDGVWRLTPKGREAADTGILQGESVSATFELSDSAAIWQDNHHNWHPLFPIASTSAHSPPLDVDLSPHPALRVTQRQTTLTFAAFDGGPVFTDERFFTDVFDQVGMDEQGRLHTLSKKRCLLQRDPDNPGLITATWTAAAALRNAATGTDSWFFDMVNNALWLRLDRPDGTRQLFRLGQAGSGQALPPAETTAIDVPHSVISWRLKHQEASIWQPCISDALTGRSWPLAQFWSEDRFSWDDYTSFGFMDEHTLAWQSPAGLVIGRLAAGKAACPILAIVPGLEGACSPARDSTTGRILGLCVGIGFVQWDVKTSRLAVQPAKPQVESTVIFAPDGNSGPVRMTAQWREKQTGGHRSFLLSHRIPGLQSASLVQGGRFLWDHASSACGDGAGRCVTLHDRSIFHNRLAGDSFDLIAAGTLSSPMVHVRTHDDTIYVANDRGDVILQSNLSCKDWSSTTGSSRQFFMHHEQVSLDANSMVWTTGHFHAWDEAPGNALQLDPPGAPVSLIKVQSPGHQGLKWSFDESDSLAFIRDARQEPWLALHTQTGVWTCPWHSAADVAFNHASSRMVFAIGSSSTPVKGPGRIRVLPSTNRLQLQTSDSRAYTWQVGDAALKPATFEPPIAGAWSVRDGKLWHHSSQTTQTNDFLFFRKQLDDVVELIDTGAYGTWLICIDRTLVKLIP